MPFRSSSGYEFSKTEIERHCQGTRALLAVGAVDDSECRCICVTAFIGLQDLNQNEVN